MNSNGTAYDEVLVGGMTVIIPTDETWREIVHNPIFLGTPVFGGVAMKKLVTHLVAFVFKHKQQFRLGLFRSSTLKNWTVLPLFLLEWRLQPVQIEYITCGQCSSHVTIANPTEPTLYHGLPDGQNDFQNSFDLPRVPCPNCQAALPRIAVWAEPEHGVGKSG